MVRTPLLRVLLLGASASALVLACGRSTTNATTLPSPISGPTVSIPGCEVTVSSAGTPLLADPKSPYFDFLGIASSTDGLSARDYREALPHASAPDGTRLPDGSTAVYYNSGETGGVWMARLAGGTLTPVSAITVNGVLRPQWMADVDVTLVDGRVRMFYLNGEGGGRRFCVAESADGLTFQTVALAMQFSGTEADPSVVRLADGTWLMAFSRANHSEMGLARSSDGLSFTQFATAPYGVVPELTLTGDGRARVYVCAAGNVESYTSPDNGRNWTRDGVVIRRSDVGRRIVCDPTFIPGAATFVFKTTDA